MSAVLETILQEGGVGMTRGPRTGTSDQQCPVGFVSLVIRTGQMPLFQVAARPLGLQEAV